MAIISAGMINEKINGIQINTSIKCHSSNYTNKSSRDVKYVVIHYTGNKSDNALNNCKYFQGTSRSASAHYFVDDANIYQSVELRDSAWHCGCSKGYKTACRNTNSFGIEMCTSGNYTVSEKTQINSAYLCAYLCKMIGITASTVDTYVLRHFDCVKTDKKCPLQYVNNPSQFVQFKTWVKNILNTGSHLGKQTPTVSPNNAPTTSTSNTTTSTKYTKKKFIKDVQKTISAKVDGVVGEETLSKLVTVSKTKNNKHSIVKPLQKYLNAKGFSCGKADGVFGENTHKAVIAYQTKKGLTADGIVGKNTWKKLFGV